MGYVVADEPLGTGGALKNAEHILRNDESFLLINGDILTDLDPNELLEDLEGMYLGAIALVQLPSPYGIVKFDEKTCKVISFVEKPRLMDYWINAGVYVFKREAFNYLPERGI